MAQLFFLSHVLKFYCDVITRSRLQFINTSIDTFFSKFCGFLADQREQGRPMMVKRKLDGTMDKLSADQEICKSDRLNISCEKSGGLYLVEAGLTAG